MTIKTLYQKLLDSHTVKKLDDSTVLLYIDRHLVHEVTSPQAFEGLQINKRDIWRKKSILAVEDHNVPTVGITTDKTAIKQLETLSENCKTYNLTQYKMGDIEQGIVHIMGPEQGFTLPGTTVVCGDSHTSTHGAFAALAFGIGTSEVEAVMATNCLIIKKSKTMLIKINGKLKNGVYAKDLALYVIGQIGTAGATGYAIEFAGEAIENLSIESRMTLCNMAIEAGARSGLIAVDNKTIEYFKNKPYSPKKQNWQKAVTYWQTLKSDDGAEFDKTITFNADDISPQVTWGTSPQMVADIDGQIPDPQNEKDKTNKKSIQNALNYMDLKPNQKITDIKIDKAFIGSCTNGRLEDLKIAASMIDGKKIADNIKLALVVPGSGQIKQQAEKLGLDKIFKNAGFQWRNPGCSMCLAMNDDKLEKGDRCASTSNRNFEGRQGAGSRTHLCSPATAVMSAIKGYLFSTI
ncbi:MAG: 3-isopropylmalate dehydratase large subunit [Gammaproteobacteria bacterium]|nr:MAG: 3-isopropylmalate dehydratase large subunit [Gammaproteobacteria bacterium]